MTPPLDLHASFSHPRNEPSAAIHLPNDLLKQLIDDVRRYIPQDKSAAHLSLERLTTYVARSSDAFEARASDPNFTVSQLRSGGLAPWQARRVERFITDHIDAPIRIADLASLVSLCSSHFCRAFRSHFGDAPHGFVMRRRIEHAQHLMTTTIEPLSQIALMCGLSDQAHLSRLFRRHLGTTPSNWRRQVATQRAA